MHKQFTAMLVQDDETSGCGIELPFNPKQTFGKARAPVRVTIGGHTFRTTTCTMFGSFWIPVNRVNREGAGIRAGQKVKVRMEADTEPRVITPSKDFASALRKNRKALQAWEKLSYSHQKAYFEAIEEAKKPQTRLRRIEGAIRQLTAKP